MSGTVVGAVERPAVILPLYKPIRQRWRELQNEAEHIFEEKARENGWTSCKRGWPDFWCTKDGRLIVVEVKKHPTHHLKKEQAEVMRLLCKHGIECFFFSPDSGLVRITSAMWKNPSAL